MESIEQKKRRLYGKRYLEEYLKELNALTNIKVFESNLMSIVESDLLGTVIKSKVYKTTIKFNDKEKLLLLVGEMIKTKNKSCYLYTTYSEDCGVLKLKSLNEFNINFNFDDEHGGLIKIVLEDLSNELILDFYNQENDIYLDIEVFGNEWVKALKTSRFQS
nr:hypothetical protein [uncultured Flavobacterium sp.]